MSGTTANNCNTTAFIPNTIKNLNYQYKSQKYNNYLAKGRNKLLINKAYNRVVFSEKIFSPKIISLKDKPTNGSEI